MILNMRKTLAQCSRLLANNVLHSSSILLVDFTIGQSCCAVEWGSLWQRIVEVLEATLSAIMVEQQPTTAAIPTECQSTEPLTELWHLAMRGDSIGNPSHLT